MRHLERSLVAIGCIFLDKKDLGQMFIKLFQDFFSFQAFSLNTLYLDGWVFVFVVMTNFIMNFKIFKLLKIHV